jgi:carboxyl-terminal processing protease
LPAGTPIVVVKHRDGVAETKTSNAATAPTLANVPVVVLVNGDTSSSAELLTAAVQEGRHATVVGSHTFGKWTVQQLDDLSNGYAIKYTTALFTSPSGHSYEGTGLVPDVEVDLDTKAAEKAWAMPEIEKRLTIDSQLRTALSLARTQL